MKQMFSVFRCIDNQFSSSFTCSHALSNLLWYSLSANTLCYAADSSKEALAAGVNDMAYYDFSSKIRHYAISGDFTLALHTLHCMCKTNRRAYNIYDINALMYWCCQSNKNSFDALVKLYQAMKIYGPKPNAVTFETLINGMLSDSALRNSVLLVDDMFKFGYTPSFSLLSALLRKLIMSRKGVESLLVLERLLRLGYIPEETSFFSLITMLCKNGTARQAFPVFSALCRIGIVYQGYTLAPIIWSLCKSGKSNCALQMHFWMRKRGLKVNVCTYTALVYGFCKERRLEDALWCLNEMRRIGRTPNVITYTVLLKHLCDKGMIDEATGMLDLMENERCGPDLHAYNIVIRELCNQDKISRVVALYDTMKRKNVPIDAYTITAFGGRRLKTRKFGFYFKMMLDALSYTQSIDTAVYNIYFNCLCRMNRTKDALIELNKMEDKGINPDSVSYGTILNGFCREGKLHRALKVLDLCKPNIVSYNTVLSWASKFKNKSVIDRALSLMEEHDMILDECGFCSLVSFAFSCGSFELLDTLMNQSNCPPINKIVANLCRRGLVGTAVGFADRFGSLLDAGSYNTLIQATLKKNENVKVHRLLNEMLTKKLKPDVLTYKALIRKLCSQGRVSSALELMNRMRKEGAVISSTEVYNMLMKAMIRKGKLMYALCLLEDMLIEGCVFNEVTLEVISEIKWKHLLKICPDVLHIMEHGYLIMCCVSEQDNHAFASFVRRIRD